MRTRPIAVTRSHSYARNKKSHGHFGDTVQSMPPYSLEAVPYRWTQRELADEVSRRWGIETDQALEDRADQLMGWSSAWVQDRRNQSAMLDSFFSAIQPRRSLVFVYAKDLPLLEVRPPGARILLGVGWVTRVDPMQEWSYAVSPPPAGALRSVLWERSVHHSIRPDCEDGFLLPYHELLRSGRLAGEDLQPFLAHAPADHFEEFSYVSELVTQDGAIAALMELARVVDLLPGVADGPWDRVRLWLADRIADAWSARGAYPGIGAVLAAAGLERGPVLAHRILGDEGDTAADPWPVLDAAIRAASQTRGVAAGLVGRVARLSWERITADTERFRLLRLLARFPLTTAQARRLFDREERRSRGVTATDAELLSNPYLLYELDRGRLDSVSLSLIDRGLFPRDAAARATLVRDPLAEPVTESADDRRIRAACTHLLERAASAGHTLLGEPGLRRELAGLSLEPRCDPTSDLFELAAYSFPPTLRETPLAHGQGRGWQLERLAQVADLIATEVGNRVGLGPIEADWDWEGLIDAALEERPDPGDPDEVHARVEKAAALRALAQARVSALVGPAGTGKTSMLRALCTHPDVEAGGVLLLAPTGKARVQLGSRIGARALTLAQFLKTQRRWDAERGYHLNPDAPRARGYRTDVVDECSMLTEEMLGALIDAVHPPDRLVLCGDHRQLPPIGPGRPFADLVAHLRSAATESRSGAGLAELSISRRQRGAGRSGGKPGRDDLAVASSFRWMGPRQRLTRRSDAS
jgi:hypothetical protein